MAGFEVIVRPVVFPSIRPPPSRSLPPEDDPEQGFAEIGGAGGGLIALSESFSASGSRPVEQETERTFDVARITPSHAGAPASRAARAAEESGVYVDVEIVNKLVMRNDDGTTARYSYTPIAESDNVSIIRRNVTRTT